MPTPALKIFPTEKPPVINGKLEDDCWKRSSVAGGFITTEGFWANEQTTCYITYDKNNLYIGCRFDESRVATIA